MKAASHSPLCSATSQQLVAFFMLIPTYFQYLYTFFILQSCFYAKLPQIKCGHTYASHQLQIIYRHTALCE